MSSLPPGAFEMAHHHPPNRVPWNDIDWTGRVCAVPGAIHAHPVVRNIKERKKNTIVDEYLARHAWQDQEYQDVPPSFAPLSGRARHQSATTSTARSRRTNSPEGSQWRKRPPSVWWAERTTEEAC
ncbi:UNVERIFIED_CONTAM: hypothetical protein DES50_108205 [Williamsia faeni]